MMKQKLILLVSIALCSALVFFNGCSKTEEPQKPNPSTASSPSQSSAAGNKTSLPAGAEKTELSAPLPNQPGVEPAIPSTGVPVTQPTAPGAAVVPAQAAPAKLSDKDIIMVAGFSSSQLQNGAPAGWVLDIRNGGPSLTFEKGPAEHYALHMRSDSASSFGIKKGTKVDIREYPYLNWTWKATRLPHGGDVRKTRTDDQALQIYVAFTPSGFPQSLNTPVVGYIWDNETPKEWTGRSSHIGGGKLRYVVVRNKTDKLAQWYSEKRNIYDDYRKLFKDIKGGEPAGTTQGFQLHINSQNTASEAEGYICDVYFSKR
jgi:hypothetical protein